MIRDINIDNRKIYISYSSSQKLLYPSEDIFPSDKLFPAEWIEFSNIVQGSVRLSEVIVDSQITFGQLFCSEFEVTVYDIDDISGKYIQVYMEDDGVYKNIFFGQVVSCKLDNTELDRQIVAYDSAYTLRDVNVASWWNLFWADKETATVKECRESLLLTQEVPFEDVELDNDNVVIRKNVDFTYMAFGTVLQMLCEINGCFPHFSRNGTLEFIVLQTEQQAKDITNLYEGLNSQFEDYTVDAVTGIEFYDSDNELKYLVGTPENTYKMTSNIFLYDMGTNELEVIGQTLLDYLSELTYRPANVKMIVGDLFYELGDRIHTPKGDFYIMEQEFSASQLIEQTMICKGEQKLGKSSRNLNNDLTILGEKYSKLSYDVENFHIEFGDYQDEVSSRFDQTAEQIVLEVQRGTENMHPTYSGSYVPTTSNYPASNWTTEALKQKNLDSTFFNTAERRTYRWTRKSNAVQIIFSTDSSTEGASNYDYVTIHCYYNGQWRQSRAFYGGYNGSTNRIAGQTCIIPTSQFYIYLHADGNVQDYGFRIAGVSSVYVDNPLVDMPTVASLPSATSTTVLTGEKNKPESAHPYANSSRLLWNWNTQIALSNTGYGWILQEEYAYSQIRQTADEISLKVSKGDVSSQLSIESGKIELASGRLIIRTGNFQVDENGKLTCYSADFTGGTINLGGSQNGILNVKDANNNLRGQWSKDGLTIWDTSGNTKFKATPYVITWDTANSKMDQNGKITLSSAEFRGGSITGTTINLGNSSYGSGNIYLFDSNNRTRGSWTSEGIRLFDSWEDEVLRINSSALKYFNDGDEIFTVDSGGMLVRDWSGNDLLRVTNSKVQMNGDLDTGDISIYDHYIKYDSENFIDMYGYVGGSSGIHINGNQVVFSSDSFGVTEWRDSTIVHYGIGGEYHYRDEYGTERCFKFLHGVLVDWW